MSPRTRSQVAWESWSTPRAHVQWPEWPWTGGRHRGPADPSASHPGHLVNPVGSQNRTRVARKGWLTTRALGPGPESPGTAGQPSCSRTLARVARDCWLNPGALGQSESRPGQLFNPAAPRARPRVARDRSSTPRADGQGPESPRTVGRPCGPSDKGPNCAEYLVDPVGPRTWAGVAQDSWSTGGPRTQAQVPWESWSIPQAFGPGLESARSADRPRGPSDRGQSHPRLLVDPAGTMIQTRVARESW